MNKSILVLMPRYPFPLHEGGLLRIYYLCLTLSKSYKLTLLTFSEKKKNNYVSEQAAIFSSINVVYLPKWRSYLNVILGIFTTKPLQLAYYRSNEFANNVKRLLPAHDVILAHLIRAGQYVEDVESKVKILEMTDVLTLTYNRVIKTPVSLFKKLLYLMELSRIKRYEQRVVNKFDLISLVSSSDYNYFIKNICFGGHIKVYRLGVDCANIPFIGLGNDQVISFVGQMRSLMNIDACNHFINDIFPKIRQQMPDVIFRIVGSIPNNVANAFKAFDGVEVTGFVPSISEAIEGSFVAVCPMRIAAGIQTKILEYMALGIPAIVTSIAYEGLDCSVGQEILVEDDPDKFAQKVIELYKDQELRANLANRARKYVQNNHDWQTELLRFVDDVDLLVDKVVN